MRDLVPCIHAVETYGSCVGANKSQYAFLMLHRRLEPAVPAEEADPGSGGGSGPVAVEPEPVGRRRFLVAGGVTLGLAAATGVVGQYLSRRRQADASRSALRLPSPVSPSATASAGTDFGLDGLSPFYTPNDEFYRVDTALIVPSVPAEEWSLRVHGMVDRELRLDFGQLTARPLMERDITLACVSNEVGGSYVGNARWVGVSLADLLDEAGLDPAATQLVSKSADGFTAGTPVSAVTDGRDAMLAVAMNGEPLPIEHGFPVRMVVPGLYGYVSATKWLVDLELSTFEAFDPYWIRRGWAERAPIKTQSRIDTPRQTASLPPGEVTIAGVAWAQHRGIERVEVRVDEGEWREAELSTEATIDTWRQWRLSVPLEAGSRRLEVRATDGEGEVQTADWAEPFPDGATGWHAIVIQVG
jgi:DMSO/TMAO reductase YedYZ molybdopterin-dependent catalytic subunit